MHCLRTQGHVPKTSRTLRKKNPRACAALQAQRSLSEAKACGSGSTHAIASPGRRAPRSAKPSGWQSAPALAWTTANPYQVRHTYASTLLTDGHNPWYVADQLGHEDVEMVFRTYGKFIRDDYQKPKPELRIVGSK